MCFVLKKVLEIGFKVVVVVNKIDCEGVCLDYVVDIMFDLFCNFGATDE